MSVIQPFKALRPLPIHAAAVASRPYDVLNSEEARVEAKGNGLSFLQVTKSEINLDPSIDTHSQAVYDKALENLTRLRHEGILLEEENACYYIYTLVMKGRSQTGLVCVSSVDDYENDLIKKHEFTRPEKEKDRIDHMCTIGAQTGNVFLAYRDVEAMHQCIEDWRSSHAPLFDFTAGDGIQHTIWRVNDPDTVQRMTTIFAEQVPCTYIADGHHRAASAAKAATAFPDSQNARFFLTTIFPASQLAILDYNRVIKELNGHSVDSLLAILKKDFIISPSAVAVSPTHLHQLGMYLEGKWYQLEAKEGTYGTDPIGVLDITIFTKLILEKHLDIEDQRTDKRIDFVGGIRGLSELEKRVDSGEMKIAFSFYPVSIEQLFAIADSGNVMPPKSTWFEPKLRDGLLTHLI
ncbi:MAG: DUF1015 domain-containing protein [Bacteroidetes bacterium]|nr:DUF1015 domain-containing protein [Bacteroidota bacterium]